MALFVVVFGLLVLRITVSADNDDATCADITEPVFYLKDESSEYGFIRFTLSGATSDEATMMSFPWSNYPRRDRSFYIHGTDSLVIQYPGRIYNSPVYTHDFQTGNSTVQNDMITSLDFLFVVNGDNYGIDLHRTYKFEADRHDYYSIVDDISFTEYVRGDSSMVMLDGEPCLIGRRWPNSSVPMECFNSNRTQWYVNGRIPPVGLSHSVMVDNLLYVCEFDAKICHVHDFADGLVTTIPFTALKERDNNQHIFAYDGKAYIAGFQKSDDGSQEAVIVNVDEDKIIRSIQGQFEEYEDRFVVVVIPCRNNQTSLLMNLINL